MSKWKTRSGRFTEEEKVEVDKYLQSAKGDDYTEVFSAKFKQEDMNIVDQYIQSRALFTNANFVEESVKVPENDQKT